MANGLETLKEIGANKIHNETHISREFIQAIIHESFEGMQSVQFNGFVSILEKTYDVDLSELRVKGKEHFNEAGAASLDSSKIFIVTDNEKSNTLKYLIIGTLLVLGIFYYSFVYVNSVEDEIEEFDNTKIENVKKAISISTQDTTASVEKNKAEENNDVAPEKEEEKKETSKTEATIVTEKTKKKDVAQEAVKKEEKEPEVEKKEAAETEKNLTINTKKRKWIGYIDIKSGKKYSKTISKDHSLEADKNWLLLFGAGAVSLNVNGEEKNFKSKKNMRFKYVDGVFTKIEVEEFKRLNKGRKW